MQPRRLGRVKHGHGTGARRDHLSVGKADPLASVSVEELVTGSPVGRLVLAPVRVDLPGDLGGQLVGNAFHGTPRVNSDSPHLHSTSDPAVRRDHVIAVRAADGEFASDRRQGLRTTFSGPTHHFFLRF